MSSYLDTENGAHIAYHKTDGQGPCVVFLGGFKSDMTGGKASALEAHMRAQGRAFIRFDYRGHGVSSAEFTQLTIGDWLADALAVIDRLTQGPLVLVGSSMGGWLMLLAALRRRERVKGLVGIASAPDFTERLIWDAFDDAQKRQLMEQGSVPIPNCYGGEPYHITHQLIEEGRNHLLLDAPIALSCPVRLLHGTADEDVPHAISQRLMERLESQDVRLTLIKDGDHRLSAPPQLALLAQTVDEVVRLTVDG